RADKAIKELRKALRLKPDQPEATLALAEALLARGRAEEAREAIDGAEVLEGGAHGASVEGEIALALGDLERAYAAFVRALKFPGLDAEDEDAALRGAARAALETRRLEEARHWVKQGLARGRGGSSADLYAMLGVAAEIERADGSLMAPLRHAEVEPAEEHPAWEHYRAALTQDPEHGPSMQGRARLHLGAGRGEEAARWFQRSLEVEHRGRAEDALLGLGLVQLAREDPSGARQLVEEALGAARHSASEDADAWHAMGLVALEMGDAAEALVALRRSADHAARPEHVRHIEQDLDHALERLRPMWRLPRALEQPSDLDRVLQQIQEFIAQDGRLMEFLPETQKMISTLNAPLAVAIMGEFNAGKSTMINALIGEEVVPMGVLPTTAHLVVIEYGPRQAAKIVYRDEREEEVTLEQARQLMKTNADDIERLEYVYPHPELRTVRFWDTPGFNALDERHEQTAQRALEQAEGVLWVLDANQVLSQTEFDRIESLPSGRERLLVVINKIDRLGPPGVRDDAVAELVEYVEDHAGDYIAGCYPVSALQALQAMKSAPGGERSGPEDAAHGDPTGFEAFHQRLQEQLVQRAGRIKTIEGKRHLGRLVFTLSALRAGLTMKLGRLADEVRGLEEWLGRQARTRPALVGRDEQVEVEDQSGMMLGTVVEEIDEAIKTRETWVKTTQELSAEDREFVQELMMERFETILERSRERVLQDVAALETQIAQRLGPVVRELSLQDARGVTRRLEGFYDEIRVLKLVLEERVYGRLEAQALGQIQAAGESVLRELERHEDRGRWKGLLRGLLPQVRQTLAGELEQWYAQLFVTAARLCERVARDLSVLEMEARVRYDLEELEALVLESP
ncbi:MAG: dynamin family protein, partial [Myxococcota bacterium]